MAERQFGPYRLVQQLATGGMAEIHLARARGVGGFEKYVALKMIHPNLSSDREFVRMLIDEAKLVVHLQHGAIAQVFDLGQVDGTYYIAMEYVDGCDLFRLLKKAAEQERAVPIEVALYIAKDVLAGLDHAHRKRNHAGRPLGIVHRDVSPQNVLLSHAGEVKLVDFGIAKASLRAQQTAAGVIKGKYHYMSPEQALGEQVDHRSDTFSAGILLYEMLAGRMLYLEDDLDRVLERVRAADVAPISTRRRDVPRELERILMRALLKKPHLRWQSAHDFGHALERLLHERAPDFTAARLAAFVAEILGGAPTTRGVAGVGRTAATPRASRITANLGRESIMSRTEFTDDNSVIFGAGGLSRQETVSAPPPLPPRSRLAGAVASAARPHGSLGLGATSTTGRRPELGTAPLPPGVGGLGIGGALRDTTGARAGRGLGLAPAATRPSTTAIREAGARRGGDPALGATGGGGSAVIGSRRDVPEAGAVAPRRSAGPPAITTATAPLGGTPAEITDRSTARREPSAPAAARSEPSAAERREPSTPAATHTERSAPAATRTEPSGLVARHTEPSAPVATRGEPSAPVATRSEPSAPVATHTEPSAPAATRSEPSAPATIRVEETAPWPSLAEGRSPWVSRGTDVTTRPPHRLAGERPPVQPTESGSSLAPPEPDPAPRPARASTAPLSGKRTERPLEAAPWRLPDAAPPNPGTAPEPPPPLRRPRAATSRGVAEPAAAVTPATPSGARQTTSDASDDFGDVTRVSPPPSFVEPDLTPLPAPVPPEADLSGMVGAAPFVADVPTRVDVLLPRTALASGGGSEPVAARGATQPPSPQAPDEPAPALAPPPADLLVGAEPRGEAPSSAEPTQPPAEATDSDAASASSAEPTQPPNDATGTDVASAPPAEPTSGASALTAWEPAAAVRAEPSDAPPPHVADPFPQDTAFTVAEGLVPDRPVGAYPPGWGLPEPLDDDLSHYRIGPRRGAFLRWALAVLALAVAVGVAAVVGNRLGAPPPPPPGTLEVRTIPSGARVTVDGRDVHQAPLVLNDLPLGKTVRLRAEREGYEPAEREVTVTTSGTRTVVLPLELIRGRLRVSSDPPGAQVYLNNQSIGVTPLDRRGLEIVDGVVEVRMAGRKPERQPLSWGGGREVELTFRLARR